MKIITINLSEPHVKALQMLQDLGLYPSRSEAIRVAIRDFLQAELGFTKIENEIDMRSEEWKAIQEQKKGEIIAILRKLRAEREAERVKREAE